MSTRTNGRSSKGGSGFKAGLAAGLVGLMVLGAAGMPALAAELIGPGVSVAYDDLDITTAAGAQKLYERIQHAAANVCPQADSQRLAEYAAATRCRNDVVAHAVSSIGSPQLTAIYAARAHHGAHSPV